MLSVLQPGIALKIWKPGPAPRSGASKPPLTTIDTAWAEGARPRLSNTGPNNKIFFIFIDASLSGIVVPRILARHFPEAEATGPRRRALRPKLAENGGHNLKAEIAAQIAAALREHGISQRAFAALIGKTSGAVQNLLNPATNVTLANLARTAAALGLELRIELRRANAPAGDRPPAKSE